jgi:uracil-DNA glycosylase
MPNLDLFDSAPDATDAIPEAVLPASWQPVVGAELQKSYFRKLLQFLTQERAAHTVFPPAPEVYTALRLTPYEAVRVLIVGQDPYHDHDQAHGLAFSVRPGVPPPPSLVNMFRELRDDLGCKVPNHGHLARWAEQGVLLLNTVLTVRAHQAASHKGKGWETFTDAVLEAVSAKPDPVVFVLWGAHAQKKLKLIDATRHTVVQSAHPSPLSARNGFFGSRPYSAVNRALEAAGKPPIDWCLPDL